MWLPLFPLVPRAKIWVKKVHEIVKTWVACVFCDKKLKRKVLSHTIRPLMIEIVPLQSGITTEGMGTAGHRRRTLPTEQEGKICCLSFRSNKHY